MLKFGRWYLGALKRVYTSDNITMLIDMLGIVAVVAVLMATMLLLALAITTGSVVYTILFTLMLLLVVPVLVREVLYKIIDQE